MRRYIVIGIEGSEDGVEGATLWLSQELPTLTLLYDVRVYYSDPVDHLPGVPRWIDAPDGEPQEGAST